MISKFCNFFFFSLRVFIFEKNVEKERKERKERKREKREVVNWAGPGEKLCN